MLELLPIVLLQLSHYINQMKKLLLFIFITFLTSNSKAQQGSDSSIKAHHSFTDIVLEAPSHSNQIKSHYKYFEAHLNKNIWYCDVIESATEQSTGIELALIDKVLTIVIDKKVRRKFNIDPLTFLRKQVCIKGLVVPYHGKYSIVINNPEQLQLVGY